MLFQWDSVQNSSPQSIFEAFQVQGASENVEGFAKVLVKGVIEHRSEIDQIIHKNAEHWTLNRMPIVDRNILRSSIFELLYLDEIPAKVTLNEAIEVAKRFGSEDSGKFVNGVLDNILQKNERLFQKLKSQEFQNKKINI
jgi:N utilization substance protein B